MKKSDFDSEFIPSPEDEQKPEKVADRTIKKPIVLSLVNRKGGSSKTISTLNLSYLYAQLGYRVLVVDADPQGSATQILGIDRNIGNLPEVGIDEISKKSKELRNSRRNDYPIDDLFGNATTAEMDSSRFRGLHDLLDASYYQRPITRADVKRAIVRPEYKIRMSQKERREIKKSLDENPNREDAAKLRHELEIGYNFYEFGFDLLPSSEELTDDELSISFDQNRDRAATKGVLIKLILNKIVEYCDYDIIMIDCPPSLGMMSVNAMVASDACVICALPDEQSLWSLQKLRMNIRQIKIINPDHLGCLGVVLSNCTRGAQINEIISYKIVDILKMYQFHTKIYHSGNAAKSITGRLLFAQIDSNAYDSYEKLAKEILHRYDDVSAWEEYRRKETEAAYDQYRFRAENITLTTREIMDKIRDDYDAGKLWEGPRAIPDERYRDLRRGILQPTNPVEGEDLGQYAEEEKVEGEENENKR